MNQNRGDLDQMWQGLEPEQPRRSRGPLLVALAAAAFLLLGVCALAYTAMQRRESPPQGLIVPPPATFVSQVATETAENVVPTATVSTAPTATLPVTAATATLFPAADEAVATRRDTPPLIDADLADWGGFMQFASPYLVYQADGWDGSDDLVAVWQVSWDDDYLFFAFDISDDVHVQNQTGNQIFRGDSIDLQIDTGRAGNFSPVISPDDLQITLSAGDFAVLPPSAFRFQGTADNEMRDAPGGHNILVAARPSASGYVLEAAVPWQDLNMTPYAGLVIGLAVNVSDNDRPGTAVQEIMKSSAPNRRFGDPTTWGTLRLE